MGLLSQWGKELEEAHYMGERAKRVNGLTLDTCIKKAYEAKKEYPQITGFLINVKQVGVIGGDSLEVTVGYLDKNHMAIARNDGTALGFIQKANTLDEKMVNLLDGNNSAIYEL